MTLTYMITLKSKYKIFKYFQNNFNNYTIQHFERKVISHTKTKLYINFCSIQYSLKVKCLIFNF